MDQSGRALVRGSHEQVASSRHPPIDKELKSAIEHWIAHWNEEPKPFVWHKSADEILDTPASYCARISDSGHQLYFPRRLLTLGVHKGDLRM